MDLQYYLDNINRNNWLKSGLLSFNAKCVAIIEILRKRWGFKSRFARLCKMPKIPIAIIISSSPVKLNECTFHRALNVYWVTSLIGRQSGTYMTLLKMSGKQFDSFCRSRIKLISCRKIYLWSVRFHRKCNITVLSGPSFQIKVV